MYFNWDNVPLEEDNVKMCAQTNKEGWNPEQCDQKRGYICEKYSGNNNKQDTLFAPNYVYDTEYAKAESVRVR